MSLNLKMLGTNIQSKRKSKHLNQEELAYRVGISRNYLSMIETGKKEVSITYLVELAENLECTVNDFLIGSQNYDTTDTAREIEDLLLDCNPTEKIIILEMCMSVKKALFYDLCKHGKWHKIQNGNRAGKSQGCLLPIIAY